MKKLFYVFLVMFACKAHATIYTFTGYPSYLWTNVAGWSPSYPGTTINAGDTVHIPASKRLDIASGTVITLNGVLIIDSAWMFNTNLHLKNNGHLIVGATGKIVNRCYLYMDDLSLMEIYGNVDIKGTLYEMLYMTDSSKVIIHPGGQLFIEDSIRNGYSAGTSIIVNGTMVNDGLIYNEGTINGTGSIVTTNNQLNGNITGGGYVAPGLSPGELKIDFDYTMDPMGNLNIELGGVTPGTTYDVLGGTGDKIAGGTLNVSLYNGFAPQIGNTFTIITGGAVSGTFNTINYPVLPAGMAWNIQYNATNVVLMVTAVTGMSVFNTDMITLYPNPVKDKLYISGLQNEVCNYKIYSIAGQVLQAGVTDNKGFVNLGFSNSGLNFIEFTNPENKKAVKSFVITE